MRDCARGIDLRRAVCHDLNCLLGTGEQTDVYWSIFVQLEVMSKFSSYTAQFWTMKEKKSLSLYVSKSALLAELQAKTGIRISAERLRDLDFESENPFKPEDLLSIDATVKRMVPQTLLNDLLQGLRKEREEERDALAVRVQDALARG